MRRDVGIVGAGPIGLYAAFRLPGNVVVWEAGEIGENVASWDFVELFSDMELNLPPDVRAALIAENAEIPRGYITGREYRERVLEPLAALLERRGVVIKRHSKVLGVGRGRLLKGEAVVATGDARRQEHPFRVLVETEGVERYETCAVLVDCSGSYGNGLWCGVGGTPAPGEAEAERRGLLTRRIPEPGPQPPRVAVVGSGYSAATALKVLVPEVSEVLWVARRVEPYEALPGDPLPQRRALATFGNGLAKGKAPNVTFRGGAVVVGVRMRGDEVDVELEIDGGKTETRAVDKVFALCGYKPDASLYSELHMHACYASDGPISLAATLLAAAAARAGGGASDCLAQAKPGPATLDNPEPNFYILGMKSYGRNSSFLMRVGFEQVNLLAGALST